MDFLKTCPNLKTMIIDILVYTPKTQSYIKVNTVSLTTVGYSYYLIIVTKII